MTARTAVMCLRFSAYQRIIVAVSTARCTYSYQGRMITRWLRMLGFPGACMTGLAVAAYAEALADR